MCLLCWVCVCASVRRSLCLFWRETQTKGLSLISPARLEVDEERNVPEKTQGQLTKDDGEMLSTTESRERTVSRRRQWGKTVKNEFAFLVAFVEVLPQIHTRDNLQIHRECKVSQNSLSCAWSWPKFVFVRSFFFFHPLGCILCGRKEMCDTPVRNHWMNHWPRVAWFKEVDKSGPGLQR